MYHFGLLSRTPVTVTLTAYGPVLHIYCGLRDGHSLMDQTISICLIFRLFYRCLLDMRVPEDDMKKIETCRSVCGLCENVHFNIVHLLVLLSVELFVTAQI